MSAVKSKALNTSIELEQGNQHHSLIVINNPSIQVRSSLEANLVENISGLGDLGRELLGVGRVHLRLSHTHVVALPPWLS